MEKKLDISFLDEIIERKLDLEQKEYSCKEGKKKLQEKEKFYTSIQAKEEHEIKKEQSSARRNIEDKYNKQIDELERQLKKVREARADKKEAQIKERVLEKNKDLIAGNKLLNNKIDVLSKEHNVKIKSNSKLYFILMVPNGIKEQLINGAINFVFTLALLEIIHLFMPADTSSIVFHSVFVLIYTVILVLMKVYITKNMGYLIESRKIYNEIDKNIEIMNKNENVIRKDKDESKYNLTEFDEEIATLNSKVQVLSSDMKLEISSFEKNVAPNIEKEIRSRFASDIDKAKSDFVEFKKSLIDMEKDCSAMQKDLDKQISENLGKEYIKLSKVKELKKYMQANGIKNIAEALDRRYNE